MKFLTTFQAADFLDTLISLAVAFVLGTLIGAERQYRQRTAGLRTNVLVAVGAAAFVDLAMHLAGADGGVRVIAYVVSGIGFLGASVIMKQGMDVRGLNTAATLWASAAVGSCAGADMIAQAVALTVFVLAGNTLLRPLVNAINRIPLDEKASEATYYFKLAVTPHALTARDSRQIAHATPPTQSTPGAETKPPAPPEPGTTGQRPSDVPPQPARPEPEAQKSGAQPALPPAPAEKVAPPIREK